MRLAAIIMLLFSAITSMAQPKVQTDQHFSCTMETSASPDKIWGIWTDVPKWKNWDSGLKDASLKDPFGLKAKGTIISLEGRKSKFTITQYNEGESYTMRTKLPLGSLYVKRYQQKREGVTVFTHEVWFKGLTKGVFAKAFGGKFREMLPGVLQNVKKIAEE